MTNEYRTEELSCGDIYAQSAKKFSAPQLEKSRSIFADSATEFSAPQLQKSGSIWAENAKRINL